MGQLNDTDQLRREVRSPADEDSAADVQRLLGDLMASPEGRYITGATVTVDGGFNI
jgi:NAD(P)-dependent dehydrogenase (short-subunit alcohol dehydrogenase family)